MTIHIVKHTLNTCMRCECSFVHVYELNKLSFIYFYTTCNSHSVEGTLYAGLVFLLFSWFALQCYTHTTKLTPTVTIKHSTFIQQNHYRYRVKVFCNLPFCTQITKPQL
jgi:hypothetical protein